MLRARIQAVVLTYWHWTFPKSIVHVGRSLLDRAGERAPDEPFPEPGGEDSLALVVRGSTSAAAATRVRAGDRAPGRPLTVVGVDVAGEAPCEGWRLRGLELESGIVSTFCSSASVTAQLADHSEHPMLLIARTRKRPLHAQWYAGRVGYCACLLALLFALGHFCTSRVRACVQPRLRVSTRLLAAQHRECAGGSKRAEQACTSERHSP